jgi:competence ComEA-like helix-hairpin-helix protein
MKKNQWIRDYLTFNSSEQKGIMILLIIFILLVFVNQILPEEVIMPSVNFPGLEKEVERFEAEWKRTDSTDSLNRLKKFKAGYFSNRGGRGDTSKERILRKEPLFIIDLNSADTLELQRLRGIGPSYARRIIGYRNRLGGYTECRQLLEVFGLDTALYNHIKEHLAVRTDSVRVIDLNTVTFKELLRHPYFPYELTRSVILYRQKNKLFRSPDELKSVQGMNDSVFRKIRPYVCMGK